VDVIFKERSLKMAKIMWPKYVGDYALYTTINLHISMALVGYFSQWFVLFAMQSSSDRCVWQRDTWLHVQRNKQLTVTVSMTALSGKQSYSQQHVSTL